MSDEPSVTATPQRRIGASPAAAAVFAAGIAYMWFEAGFRLAFTYSATFNSHWMLWNGRVGDIAAMWLTISGVAAVAGLGLYLLWRHSDHVGFIAEWTIILAASAIAAPMIGEIGTPAGNITSGAGSSSTAAIIAWTLSGIVLVAAAVVLVWVRRRRSVTSTG